MKKNLESYYLYTQRGEGKGIKIGEVKNVNGKPAIVVSRHHNEDFIYVTDLTDMLRRIEYQHNNY